MQILISVILIILLVGFVIYKIDGRFGKKEFLILTSIIIVIGLVFTMYQKNQENSLPNRFKTEYKKQNGIEILKLSSELLNNKYVSSKKHFVYKFTYIINKDEKEYLCVADNVRINKLEDEYIFEKWTEDCTEK
jgi:CTP:phosphocholine cytidylyltransferase-like protein